jgi:UDP-N-acetylmuramate dehydrogenase
MQTSSDLPLAPLTSFHCGGNAERAITIDDLSQFDAALAAANKINWVLGFCSNSVISDKGLPGTTLIFRGGTIVETDGLVVADAGVWWDDLVLYAIGRGLWGLECMSAIPGGVGAAIVGNIAAYGQAVADTLEWVEVFDLESQHRKTLRADELGLEYRRSAVLQSNRSIVVLRAAFALHNAPEKPITYESALVVAREHNYDLDTLTGRRDAILGARERAGSLWDYRDQDASKTAGSFFRNPLVDQETAERIMSYDETGKSLELLKKMNAVHGGDMSRVSAAHVLLAAGFHRGQTWGEVRLHPQHVLKLENAGRARAQDIYNVSNEIVSTVREKLGVVLEPEVRFLGEF